MHPAPSTDNPDKFVACQRNPQTSPPRTATSSTGRYCLRRLLHTVEFSRIRRAPGPTTCGGGLGATPQTYRTPRRPSNQSDGVSWIHDPASLVSTTRTLRRAVQSRQRGPALHGHGGSSHPAGGPVPDGARRRAPARRFHRGESVSGCRRPPRPRQPCACPCAARSSGRAATPIGPGAHRRRRLAGC